MAIFAVGSMAQPQVIVSAMRSGAREFIERPTTTTELLEAFVRLSTSQRKVDREGPRGQSLHRGQCQGGQRRHHHGGESGPGVARRPTAM